MIGTRLLGGIFECTEVRALFKEDVYMRTDLVAGSFAIEGLIAHSEAVEVAARSVLDAN